MAKETRCRLKEILLRLKETRCRLKEILSWFAWDGIGHNVGTYTFFAEMEFKDGEKGELKVSITLIR